MVTNTFGGIRVHQYTTTYKTGCDLLRPRNETLHFRTVNCNGIASTDDGGGISLAICALIRP